MSLKFSVITPSFNSGDTLERAIQSVLAQDYEDFEHIIVDGGSSDNTMEILEKYPHLRWVSEPDRGQVDAMNKGFAMAEGDIIGYLNADDYYLEGAFPAAAEAFEDPETMMVMGKVRVYTEETDSWWENDPAVDFDSMLRHWEMDAFCVNPVGYFYRREVQEQIPLNPDNDDKQDLEFLLEVADSFQGGIRKVDRIFGEFINGLDTKTAQEQQWLDYWRPENFSFLDRFLAKRSPEYQEEFRARQACGYQVRTNWTIRKAIKNGWADEYYKKEELLLLPADSNSNSNSIHQAFIDRRYPLAKGSAIVVVLRSGKVASTSIVRSLQNLPEEISAYPVFSFHQFCDQGENIRSELEKLSRISYPHRLSGHAMRYVWDKNKDALKWKFIAGVRDPIAQMISAHYENKANKPVRSRNDFYNEVMNQWSYCSNFFQRVYADIIGIDVFNYPFNKKKGYTIINCGNVEILLYTTEKLNFVFEEAMRRFLGIPDIRMINANEAKSKSYRECYKNAVSSLEDSFTSEELDQFYSHKVVTHFYSDEEIASFRKRWGND